MRGWVVGVPYLALLLATTKLVDAVEKVISVGLCPPYLAGCSNTWAQTGATVGDPCSAPCQANADGTRWCPTGADHSGAIGTPWGWCAKTAAEGEADGDGLPGAENSWTVSAAIIGSIIVYVVGGVSYNYKVSTKL